MFLRSLTRGALHFIHGMVEGVLYLFGVSEPLTWGSIYLIHVVVEGVLYLLSVSEVPDMRSSIPHLCYGRGGTVPFQCFCVP